MKRIKLFLPVLLVLLLGITTTAFAAETPCNLSSLKIKNVAIDNDKDQYFATALKSELYKYGATASAKGSEIVGKVSLTGLGGPTALSAEVLQSQFAGTATLPAAFLMDTKVISNELVRRVVVEFCKVPIAKTIARK